MAEVMTKEEQRRIGAESGLHPWQVCCFCRLAHAEVADSGINWCPNAACTGTGASWFRYKLDSYFADAVSYRYTIDVDEYVEKLRAWLEGELDPAVRAAAEKSLPEWEQR